MYSLGFKEFWLTDDIFTSDQKWSKQVCEAITATGNLVKSVYYSKKRWPIYDFNKTPPKPANYQIVRKTNPKIGKRLEAQT